MVDKKKAAQKLLDEEGLLPRAEQAQKSVSIEPIPVHSTPPAKELRESRLQLMVYPSTLAGVRKYAAEHDCSLNAAANELLRKGLGF